MPRSHPGSQLLQLSGLVFAHPEVVTQVRGQETFAQHVEVRGQETFAQHVEVRGQEAFAQRGLPGELS